jgi:molybdopterin-containing oxidoreductase family membrane subunit
MERIEAQAGSPARTPKNTFIMPKEGMPFRIGRFDLAWCAIVFVLLLLVGVGGYSFLQQLLYGESVTGMRTVGNGGVPWGIYISFEIFLIGISFTSICTAALVRLLRIEPIRPLSRLAVLMTITTLLMGSICVLADLGHPVAGLLDLPKYARIQSPFFGTFTMVMGGYLFPSLVFLFLSSRADAAYCAKRATRFRWVYQILACGFKGTAVERNRHHHTTFWLALLILPLLVTAHSTLGFIFGIQGARPGWYGALQAPSFLVLASVSGIGMLLILAAFLRKLYGLQQVIQPAAFRWLGVLLLPLTAVYIYFQIADLLTSNYAANKSETKLAHVLMFGHYARYYWTVIGCLIAALLILFTLFVRHITSIGWYVTAAVLVNVAALVKRFLIVVPSLTDGLLLPYEKGVYNPTWVEYGLLTGVVAFGALFLMVFTKFFPIIEIEQDEAIPDAPLESPARRTVRIGLFWATFFAGVGLAILGFVVSARVGSTVYVDPAIPYSPVIFINGIVLCFCSAILYEIFPSRTEPKEKPS